jgi:hypothetical protein
VLAVVGVVNDIDGLNLMTFHIYKDVMGTAPEVRADYTVKAVPIVRRDSDTHDLVLLQFLESFHNLSQLLAQLAGRLFQGCDFLFAVS